MKNKDYDDDENFEGFSSDAMDQYSQYDKVEVNIVTVDLTAKAKSLIDGVARIYTSTGLSIDDEFVNSIKSVETDALVSMLKQVKYAEHMLDTLMKRLDNGGYVDKEIYDQIKSMQHHVIEMNLEVTKYTRLIPEFFKFTESDVKSISTVNNTDYQKTAISGGTKMNGIEDATIIQPVALNAPQFGTKSFLESIDMMSSMAHIEDILENEPEQDLEFNPSEISDDDEKFEDEE